MKTSFISLRHPLIRFLVADQADTTESFAADKNSKMTMCSHRGGYVTTSAPRTDQVTGTYVSTAAPQPSRAGSYVTTNAAPSGTQGTYVTCAEGAGD